MVRENAIPIYSANVIFKHGGKFYNNNGDIADESIINPAHFLRVINSHNYILPTTCSVL